MAARAVAFLPVQSSMEPATEAPAIPQHRLYSAVQVMVASLVAGPLAACWFMAENYRVLGHERHRRASLLWGVGGTLGLFVLAYFLPQNFPRLAIPLGYTLGLFHTARELQGAAVAQHLAAGGLAGAWRTVIGLSLLVLAAIMVVLFAAAFLLGGTQA